MKRVPEPAVADETTDRSEHIKGVALSRSRHKTHELRTVVVDPTVDPRKALTMRKLSKPGEAPQPWRKEQPTADRAARTVGGATMQVPTVGSRPAQTALQGTTGGVAESIAARKLKARRTVKIDETAPLPDVAPREPAPAEEDPIEASSGIDVPPPSGVTADPRLLAELTPPGLKAVKTKPHGRKKRAQTPTPLGLGPVQSKAAPEDEPYDLEDEKITRPLRRVVQDVAEADTRRLPIVHQAQVPARPAAAQGFPWPIAAATGLAVFALVAYLMFGGRADSPEPGGAALTPAPTAPAARSEADSPPASNADEPKADRVRPAAKPDSNDDAPGDALDAAEDSQPATTARPTPAERPDPAKASPSSTGRIF